MNKNLLLITLMLATFMASIDSSIVNVSLPVISKEFKVTMSQIHWVISSYMITFSLIIPLSNWLKKRIGYYYLFIGSIAIFTAGSLLCSIAADLAFLTMARVVQGIGGALIAPVSLAILSENFPKDQKGSAIGWWGVGNVMGPAIGPTLGGILTHYFGWQSIFYVNLPFGIITILIALKSLSFLKNIPKENTKLDIAAYIYFCIFLITLQYSLDCFGEKDPFTIKSIGLLIVAIVFFILFLRDSIGDPNGLFDLTIFKYKNVDYGSAIIVIRSIALFGGLYYLPFLLQGILGYTTIQAGLIMLPNALIMLVMRPVAGKLADKGMIRLPSMVGIILISISMFMFGKIDVGSIIWFIIAGMIVRGLGMSLLVAPVSAAMLNAVKKEQSSTVTAMNSLLQQVGGSIGIAFVSLLNTYLQGYFMNTKHYSDAVAQHYALQAGFVISGILIAFALIPAYKIIEVKPPPPPLTPIQKRECGH